MNSLRERLVERTSGDLKPTKMSLSELLKQKESLLAALKKEIETQAAVRKNDLAAAINLALVIRRNAISELKKAADAKQRSHKEAYDRARADAGNKYAEALAAITKEREDALALAHETKGRAYRAILSELEASAAPHVEKHKSTVKALEEGYEAAEPGHKAEGEKAIKAIQDDINGLLEEIRIRRERRPPAESSGGPR